MDTSPGHAATAPVASSVTGGSASADASISEQMAQYEKQPANALRGVARRLRAAPEKETKKAYLAAIKVALETGKRIDETKAANGPQKQGRERRDMDSSFRLMNAISSDDLCDRFVELGNPATRAQLDTKTIGVMSAYWTSVVTTFNDEDCDELNSLKRLDPAFASVDAARFKVMDAAKLWSVWRELSSEYRRVHANFSKSGSHSDFRSFDGGRIDVYYLHLLATTYKPQLLGCVLQKLPDSVAFDNLDPSTHHQLSGEVPKGTEKPGKSKDAVLDALHDLASRRQDESVNKRKLELHQEEVELKRQKNERQMELHEPSVNAARIDEKKKRVGFMLSLQRDISDLRRQVAALEQGPRDSNTQTEIDELMASIDVIKQQRDEYM